MQPTKNDITLEAALLKALTKRSEYTKFISSIDHKRLIPTTSALLKDYEKYYAKHEGDLDFSLFYTEFQIWHDKDLDVNDLNYYRETVFPLIRDSRIENGVYISLLEREANRKLTEALSKGFDENLIQEMVDEFKTLRQPYTSNVADEAVFKLADIDLEVLDSSKGLKWFLPSLQAGLGSHQPGQFVIVAADSNVGKSAFCLSQAVSVFKQLNKEGGDRPILYCTSEDTKEDLACRFLSCLYQDKVVGGFEQIIKEQTQVRSHYVKNYNNNLFIGMPIRNHNDIFRLREKIARYNPSLIIIDMLDKLSNSDNVQDLTALYQQLRGISNDGYPIIGTSQTGNTSYLGSDSDGRPSMKSRKWLSDKDLSGSKSGKQGAAYCMIMIGKDDDMPNIRYVQTTKKKRGQHVAVTCEVSEVHSSYRELL